MSSLYYLSKTNVVIVSMSKKVIGIGTLAFLFVDWRSLAMDIQSLTNIFARLYTSET